jgi:hypothetical protein
MPGGGPAPDALHQSRPPGRATAEEDTVTTTELTTMLKDFLSYLVTDQRAAENFAQDPQGTLAAQGITDHDLSDVDMAQIVAEVCRTTPLPAETRDALQDYSDDHASHGGGHQSVERIIEQVQQIQQIVHNETINHINNIDQSQNVHGDNNSLTRGDSTAALGDGAQAIGGDNHGQANTGDRAAQIDGDNEGVVNTGSNEGLQAGGSVDKAVVGDGNTTAQTGDLDHSPLNFGSGNATTNDFSGSQFGQGAAVATGGSAQGGQITQNSGNTANSHNSDDDRVDHSRTDSHDQYRSDSHDRYDSDDTHSTDSHDRYHSDGINTETTRHGDVDG